MGTGSLDRYAPLEAALNGTGFTVESTEQHGNRTVITVSRRVQGAALPVLPGSSAVPPPAPEARKRERN